MDPTLDHERRILDLEKEVRDLKTRSRGSAWGSWTPTLTQGVSVSATVFGEYTTVGKLTVVSFYIGPTGAGTAGQRVEIGGLPKTFAATGRIFGGADIQDTGTRNIHVALYSRPAGVFWMVENNTVDVVGIASAYTVASGDALHGFGVYQAA